MRAGHCHVGAMNVMVDSAIEPSKSEFRRVLQDEQLGVPLDDALMVMAAEWRTATGAGRDRHAAPARSRRQHGGGPRPRGREHPRAHGAQTPRRGADSAGAHLALDPHGVPDLRARSSCCSRAATASSRSVDTLIGKIVLGRRASWWSSAGSWIKQIVEDRGLTWVSN